MTPARGASKWVARLRSAVESYPLPVRRQKSPGRYGPSRWRGMCLRNSGESLLLHLCLPRPSHRDVCTYGCTYITHISQRRQDALARRPQRSTGPFRDAANATRGQASLLQRIMRCVVFGPGLSLPSIPRRTVRRGRAGSYSYVVLREERGNGRPLKLSQPNHRRPRLGCTPHLSACKRLTPSPPCAPGHREAAYRPCFEQTGASIGPWRARRAKWRRGSV